MPAQTVIKLRRGTAAQWTSANPVLGAGEPGLETDTNKLKFGDGTTAWNSLSYSSGGASVEVSDNPPVDAEPNTLWWDSNSGQLFINYDGFWVEAVAGTVGPQGPQGEPGIAVQTSVPADTEVLWLDSDDPADAVAIPAGGLAGQSLVKIDGADYNTAWTTLSPNYIINGAFDINQRGFTSATASGMTFDRWNTTVAGDGTATISSQSLNPADLNVSGFGDATRNIRFVTTGQTSAAVRTSMNQPIEDVRTLAGQTVTLSFWAKAASGTPKIFTEITQLFGTGGSSAVITSGGQVAISTSWARYSVTVTLPSVSGKTIGAGSYVSPTFWVSAGTDFNSRTGSLGIQSNTFDIWGVQLEAGSVATPFRRNANSLQGELAACQRYYFRASSSATAQAIGFANGISTTTTNARIFVKTPVTMRVAPTSVEFANLGISDKTNYTLAVSAISISQSQEDVVDLSVTNATGATAVRTAILVANASASAFLGLSAEL